MRKLTLTTATALVATAIVIVTAASAGTRSERFSLISTSTSGAHPTYSAIATGAFADGGSATMPAKGVVAIKLSSGSLTVHLAKGRHTVSKVQTHDGCVQTMTISGRYNVTAATGAYHGLTGSGTATLRASFAEGISHGACAEKLVAVQSVLTLNGALH